jgi:hypothetical protein
VLLALGALSFTATIKMDVLAGSDMSLPEWVKVKCRAVIRQPVSCMSDRVDNVRAEAYKHGYLWDHLAREFVYVGDTPPQPTLLSAGNFNL